MPKGVEHLFQSGIRISDNPVINSVMPKGVEHLSRFNLCQVS